MEVLVKGKVMEVLSKEYDFNGSKGITHKLVVYCDGKLNNVTVPGEQVEYFKELVGQEVSLSCSIFIKGTYNLRLNNE